ncbi:hypothetical protein [Kutzneria kofuensis]|uniref:Uncharacterized protein n=1 Tax=Kutzneria kofuensis TaxID=103725 RepID=A0A7W9KHP8_9PSEU|nr:hypothetical protein [Kutzneria kofuensis]MBB5892615.1 hypothetical protein [Kutzneria kofuensis]
MATKKQLQAQLADAIVDRDFDRVQALADKMTAIDRAEGSGYHEIAAAHRERWRQAAGGVG